MHLLQEIVVAILFGYLSFTNNLAEFILSYSGTTVSEVTESSFELSEMESKYSENLIPRILLENSNYQKASIIDGIVTPADPATPLTALVNIFCTFTTKEYIRSTTGSGFFIHQNGVILTNAHVAQFLLLEDIFDGTSSCVIRTGTPAMPKYSAELLYISPAWVQEHAELLAEARPEGTGERDYALLYVNESLTSEPLPAQFPAMAFDTNPLTNRALESKVRAAGYPALILAREGATAPLRGVEVGSTITELLTFSKNYADLFTIAGTNIGEQGSSGGPVADARGYAIGLISTRGNDATFGEGSLRAITLSYVDRTITEETGFSLVQNINGNLPFRAGIFRDTLVPFLQFMLRDQFESR